MSFDGKLLHYCGVKENKFCVAWLICNDYTKDDNICI